MSTIRRAALAVALVACVTYAQAPSDLRERALAFRPTTTAQGSVAISDAIRTIADVKASFDNPNNAVVLRGTPGELNVAEWLFRQMDGLAPAGTAPEYLVQGSDDDVVRVFHPAHIGANPSLQELVNVVRTVVEVPRMSALTEPPALAMRGTAGQVALAAWLVNALDKPADWKPPEPEKTVQYDYWNRPKLNDNAGSVRVFYTAHTETPQDLQQIVNLTRTTADLGRLFGYSQRKALVFRGTPDQTALAGWLLNALDKPAGWQPSAGQNPVGYRYHEDDPRSKNEDDSVRVFYLAAISTQDLLAIANQIRTETRCSRVFTDTTHHAVGVRGTAAQAAVAEQLVAAHSPAAPR